MGLLGIRIYGCERFWKWIFRRIEKNVFLRFRIRRGGVRDSGWDIIRVRDFRVLRDSSRIDGAKVLGFLLGFFVC